MARIFLSSTFSDLREYRAAAFRTLRQIGHEAFGLEEYVASDEPPMQRTLQSIAVCDLYVVIVGWAYGFVPERDNPEGLSSTELEYRRAVELAKPRLVFLLNQTPPAGTGPDGAEIGRANAFRARLEHDRIVGRFSSVSDFIEQLAAAVTNWQASRLPTGTEVGVDDLPLLWRLVVDFKGSLDLLRHPEPSGFAAAIAKWEEANSADPTRPWPERLDRARKDLESRQPDHQPSELWLAWMRAVRVTPPTADAQVRMPGASEPPGKRGDVA